MLVVAVLMLLLRSEVISGAFAIAMLTVGPGGAVLGVGDRSDEDSVSLSRLPASPG